MLDTPTPYIRHSDTLHATLRHHTLDDSPAPSQFSTASCREYETNLPFPPPNFEWVNVYFADCSTFDSDTLHWICQLYRSRFTMCLFMDVQVSVVGLFSTYRSSALANQQASFHHTYTHIYTHTQTYIHTYTVSLSFSLSHTQTQPHTSIRTHTHTLSLCHALSQTHAPPIIFARITCN